MFRNYYKLFISNGKTVSVENKLINKRFYHGFTQYVRKQILLKIIKKQERLIAISSGLRIIYSEEETRFNGIHITLKNENHPHDLFQHVLTDLLTRYRLEKRRSVFLQVPIEQSHLISVAANLGFVYHHARNNTAILCLWLNDSLTNKIPDFANHQLGAAGACFNEITNELLVVQDKGKFSDWWKCPGGLANLGEDLADAAVRETFEETGIKSEFRSILTLRQQHNVYFGQSDFYFICRLHPLTYEIESCPDEIQSCDWIHVNRLLEMNRATPLLKLVCKLLIKGKESGFQNIDMIGSKMQFLHGKKYTVFHRPKTI